MYTYFVVFVLRCLMRHSSSLVQRFVKQIIIIIIIVITAFKLRWQTFHDVCLHTVQNKACRSIVYWSSID